jgi:small subunit ribosomal protein S6
MLILSADADDSVITGVTDRITRVIGAEGGEVLSVDRWGKRRLAYEIEHQQEGFYIVVNAHAEPPSMRELDRVLSLADPVIRFKVVVRGDLEPAGVGAGARPSSVGSSVQGDPAPAGEGSAGAQAPTEVGEASSEEPSPSFDGTEAPPSGTESTS